MQLAVTRYFRGRTRLRRDCRSRPLQRPVFTTPQRRVFSPQPDSDVALVRPISPSTHARGHCGWPDPSSFLLFFARRFGAADVPNSASSTRPSPSVVATLAPSLRPA